MSSPSGPPPQRSGPVCHGAAHRVPADAGPRQCRRNLANALNVAPYLTDGALPALWCDPVAGPPGSPLAVRRLAAELDTPIGIGGRSPFRLTLLEYTGGVSDLVVVADAARVDRTRLDEIASAVLYGAVSRPSGAARPAKGVPAGTPAPAAEAGRQLNADADFAVALPELKSGPDAAHDLAAAVHLLLARTLAEDQVLLDVTSADGAHIWAVSPWDESEPVSAYRARTAGLFGPAGAGWSEPRARSAGLRVALDVDVSEQPADLLHYRPPAGEHALTMYAEPDGEGGLLLRGWRRPDLLKTWLTDALIRHLAHIVRELTKGDQQRPVADVSLFDRTERRRVLDLGRTGRPRKAEARTLPELVAARAAAAPRTIALTEGGTSLDYGELVERAGRFARALRSLGVGPRDRVGICLERSADLVVVMLAVLTAGGTYVPLDPAYPKERLAFTAEDAGLGLVLVDTDGLASEGAFAPGVAVPLDRLRLLAEDTAIAESPLPAATGQPDDAAYVIYTSGSTGRPKGVVVPQRNVAALLNATAADFELGGTDTWAWFHSAAFDFSVWEIWGALITGGRLVVVPYWTCRSPEDFRELLVRERVTVLSHTPSAFSRLLELERGQARLRDVRLVVLGGEPLDARGLTSWFDAHPESRCRMVNMFGITETTVHVTARTLTRADALAATRSVGRPIPGWAVRVLDAGGRLLPPGTAGEIAVSGDGLAHHYLHRPELTAQRFVTDPDDGARLYLSGDKGRMLPDGSLEHLGRLDSQVKLRGYRIELDEIRNVLLGHPSVVAASVVLNRPEGDEDAARLDAYVVLDGATPAEVRRRAAAALPEYMVPATVTRLAELPLTVNGKVDVKRLPAPAAPEPAPAPGPAAGSPRGGTLAAVLGAWRTILRTDCAPDEDFFDLGGNSLTALRISHSLRDLGVAVSVRDIYRLRTAALLAEQADSQAVQRPGTPQPAGHGGKPRLPDTATDWSP